MNLFDAAQVVVRWWFVTLPVILAIAITAVTLPANLQPEYVSTTTVLLAGPTERAAKEGVRPAEPINPLAEQSNALLTTAVVASLSVESAEGGQQLADEGLSPTFNVDVEDRTPILVISARGPSRQLATSTALSVVGLIEDHIALRQDEARIPPDERVTARVLSTGSIGGSDYGGRTRLRLLIVGFGAGVTLIVAFVLDAVSRRYGRSRRADPTDTAGKGSFHART